MTLTVTGEEMFSPVLLVRRLVLLLKDIYLNEPSFAFLLHLKACFWNISTLHCHEASGVFDLS